jgi:hypothetical protein
MVLSLSGAAVATSSRELVPPHGTVAGKGYGYYLGRTWRLIFRSPAHHLNTCATITVGGRHVAVISAGLKGPGTYKQRCTEPAGRPVYLLHVANECSSFKGDHAGFGTTNAQLKKCARAPFTNATGRTTVDGHKVAHPARYRAASGVFRIHLDKDNYFGYKRLHGRSAAYGYGVLLRRLAPGTHKVVVAGSIPSFMFHIKVTYTIEVK